MEKFFFTPARAVNLLRRAAPLALAAALIPAAPPASFAPAALAASIEFESESDIESENEEAGAARLLAEAAPAFSALTAAARLYNAELRAARAELRATAETLPQARSALLPKVSAGGGKNDDNDGAYFGQITQPLFHGPTFKRIDAQEETLAAAQAAFAQTLQEMDYRVVSARLAAHLAEDRAALLAARRRTLQTQLEVARQRELAGAGTALDATLIRSRLENVRADLLFAEADLEEALENIRLLTGARPQSLPAARPNFSPPPPAPLAQWQQRVQSGNGNLRAAQARAKAAALTAEAAAREWMPYISASARHSRTRPRDAENVLEIQASISLYTGGFRSAQRRQTAAQTDAARFSRAQLRRALAAQTAAVHTRLAASIRRLRALQDEVDARREALRAVEAGYREGVRIAADALSAEEELFDAELSLRQSRYNHMDLQAQLRRLAGAIDDEFLRALDAHFAGY